MKKAIQIVRPPLATPSATVIAKIRASLRLAEGVCEPMSALPPKADIGKDDRHVRFVPKADIARLGAEVQLRAVVILLVEGLFRLFGSYCRNLCMVDCSQLAAALNRSFASKPSSRRAFSVVRYPLGSAIL